MILSSIYMALHTFKVLCKHSLINLCFGDPVQQSLPRGTKSRSPGEEPCLAGHASCRGLPVEMETAPTGKFSSPLLGCTETCPSVLRGDVKQQNPAGMGNIDKRGTNGGDANCSYVPSLVLVQLGDLKPSNKCQCLFLGQPKSCMLTSPGSPSLILSGG